MKTIAYLIRKTLLSTVIILVGCSQNSEFKLLNGSQNSLDDYQGQWLLINFWAEWCSPCIEEIPELNRLAANGERLNLSVIGISFDLLSNPELSNFAKKWQIQYPLMATDPIPILPFSLPKTLPANYIIDPDGQIVHKLVGKQTLQSLTESLDAAKKRYKN